MPLLVFDGHRVRKAGFNDYLEIVKALVSLIPPGHVTTYASIARLLGISPRLVGRLLKANDKPLIIPCHRVIMSDGRIGGYSFGGSSFKRRLLEVEGVEFDAKGRVYREHIIDISQLLA